MTGNDDSPRPPARLDRLTIDADRVSARLSLGDEGHVVTYRVPGGELEERWEPFLVAALPFAMRRATTLSVPAPASPRLLDALPMAQEILGAWEGDLRTVEVEAEPGAPEPREGRGTAAFFSGGVDSFYTALRNLDALDALIYVHGFDIALDRSAERKRVSRSLNAAAAELGLELLEVETDLRHLSEHHCSWGVLYHGAAMASVGHLLAPRFRRLLVPATPSYRDLLPRGSHPLLDPLWSTETVEVVHEGAARRVDKIAAIATSDVAMRWLRVCWAEGAADNCGRCEKCLRTMVGLRIAGGLERCETLPDELPLDALARAAVDSEAVLAHCRENLEVADAIGTDPELTEALRGLVRRATAELRGSA